MVLGGLLLTTGMWAQTPAQKLIKRLKAIQKRGVMVGHQDDPIYGTTWKWDEGRSDVKELVGSYPAVMGFDLGKIELGSDTNLDGVSFERMRREIVAQHERGGIVTLSWHPWNPVTGENAWDPSGEAVKAVLRGGAQHRKFEGWLKVVADFINSLTTADGTKVPVIFRPWHEMNGAWFWWGGKSCTPEEYISLYTMTHHKLAGRYGCDNVVWAYSPNVGYDDYRKYYPGDQYVDLVGVDIYEFDKDNAAYQRGLAASLDDVVRFAREEGKVAAVTETGYQQVTDPDWFTQTLWPVLRKYDVSYVLFWRNAWDNEKEHYLPAKGEAAAPDFVKFAKEKKTLFADDIKKMGR